MALSFLPLRQERNDESTFVITGIAQHSKLLILFGEMLNELSADKLCSVGSNANGVLGGTFTANKQMLSPLAASLNLPFSGKLTMTLIVGLCKKYIENKENFIAQLAKIKVTMPESTPPDSVSQLWCFSPRLNFFLLLLLRVKLD